MHGRARNGRKVFSAMRRARLTVQNALAAKIAGGLGIVKRPMKAALPETLRSHGGKNRTEVIAFLVGARDFFRAGLYKLLCDTEPFDGELAGFDRHESGALHGLAMRKLGGECEVIPADRVLEVDAQKRVLNIFVGGVLPEGKRMARPLGFQFAERRVGLDLHPQETPLKRVCRTEMKLDAFCARMRLLSICCGRGKSRDAERGEEGGADWDYKPHAILQAPWNNIRYKSRLN